MLLNEENTITLCSCAKAAKHLKTHNYEKSTSSNGVDGFCGRVCPKTGTHLGEGGRLDQGHLLPREWGSGPKGLLIERKITWGLGDVRAPGHQNCQRQL